ncbi:MAG: DNA-binding transcriptional regulator [Sedimentisphaerales bacterium]|nr:DNA-binding transcriptional regulator [Sedimentisphaerales bacterium]
MSKVPKVILLIEKSRAFGRGLLHGIVQYSNLHGPWLFYMEPEIHKKGIKHSYEWIKELEADGIIGYTWDVNLIKAIVNLGRPAVIRGLDKPTQNAYCVVTDQTAIARTAVEYFLELGFRRFAYCGYDDMIWSQQRGENFIRIVTESGFNLKTYMYKQPKTKRLRTPDKEQVIIAKWLVSLPKPIAIMAGNDDRSQDVLAACKIAEINVPSEVTILGVDNDELICGLSYPQLSSIALSTQRAGYDAAQVLGKLMDGQKVTENEKEVLVSPLHVATRQSTDIMAIEDKQVAMAVHFIRNHTNEVIQVGNVAEAAGLSRRTLEQRFRKILGHSVLEEIKYARVNQMTKMLVETNLSISQIAWSLGFPYTNNISRYFKQQKGISPLEYRRRYAPK